MAMTASAQKRENKKLNKNASVEKNAGTVNRGGGGVVTMMGDKHTAKKLQFTTYVK